MGEKHDVTRTYPSLALVPLKPVDPRAGGGVERMLEESESESESESVASKRFLEFQSMWEIKQKDFVLSEKLSKQKLLISLLAKSEPLCEMEMAFKNKLIKEMLSNA